MGDLGFAIGNFGIRYTSGVLICPVQNCRLALERVERRVRCARGHSFDISRSGYINLLQPQERRSKEAGDSHAAREGRRRLHDSGVTGPLLGGIAALVAPSSRDIALDAGCGEGFYLGSLGRQTGLDAHGVDISASAIHAAARRYPEFEWVVANADRSLPYASNSFTLVLSITGRMNAVEFRRVLRQDGRLLVALSASDDLVELRGVGRDRVPRTIEMFADQFTLFQQCRVATTARLDASGIQDILNSIYRPKQRQPPEAMGVTFSLDLLLFQPR